MDSRWFIPANDSSIRSSKKKSKKNIWLLGEDARQFGMMTIRARLPCWSFGFLRCLIQYNPNIIGFVDLILPKKLKSI